MIVYMIRRKIFNGSIYLWSYALNGILFSDFYLWNFAWISKLDAVSLKNGQYLCYVFIGYCLDHIITKGDPRGTKEYKICTDKIV